MKSYNCVGTILKKKKIKNIFNIYIFPTEKKPMVIKAYGGNNKIKIIMYGFQVWI